MAKKLMDRFLGIMGFEEETVEEEEKSRDGVFRDEEEVVPASRRKGQVLNLHAQRQLKVVVSEPKAFEDVQILADNLKNRRPVIVNLEKADPELARRVVDFISGATYALNGTQQKVGSGIFLFLPNNMEISSRTREPAQGTGTFSLDALGPGKKLFP